METLQTLHRIEGKAAKVYRTINEHNARELRQDVKGSMQHLAGWLGPRGVRLRDWYLSQPPVRKVVYGLTVMPVVALGAFGGLLLVKFGGPLLLALVLAVKVAIPLLKMTAFAGYIGYKILKTILLWYYIISRSYTGNRARRERRVKAAAGAFPVLGIDGRACPELAYRWRWKNLYIVLPDGRETRVLFSYLRYALCGQKALAHHVVRRWKCYMTAWRAASRAVVGEELAPIGASLFTPHTLGPDVTDERALVPGDAALSQIAIGPDDALLLTLQVRWVDWTVTRSSRLPFLQVRRTHRSDAWEVAAPAPAVRQPQNAAPSVASHRDHASEADPLNPPTLTMGS